MTETYVYGSRTLLTAGRIQIEPWLLGNMKAWTCESNAILTYAYSVVKLNDAVAQKESSRVISLCKTIEPARGYTTICDAWPVQRHIYGYLPNQTAPPLPLGRYSFLIPLRGGG